MKLDLSFGDNSPKTNQIFFKCLFVNNILQMNLARINDDFLETDLEVDFFVKETDG